MLSYLLAYEPGSIKKTSSHEYRLLEHDSLKISNGKWCWFSRGLGGATALDFLVKVRGIPFLEAVQALTGSRIDLGHYQAPAPSPQPQEAPKTAFVLPPAYGSNNKVLKYLEGRGIDRTIIAGCIMAGSVYENTHRACVFVGRDQKGIPRYATIRGTTGDFKGEVPGSSKQYGFTLPGNGEAQEVAVFESAIDALSHATIYKMVRGEWRDVDRLSLGGVSPLALWQYMDTHPGVKSINLVLDNDEPGRKAMLNIQAEAAKKYPGVVVRYRLKEARFKDVNQYLQRIKKTEQPQRPAMAR